MQGRLAEHPSLSFNSEQTAILKMCLIKLLSEVVDKFDVLEKRKAQDQNYVHWLEDPTSLRWLRKVKEHMDVQGSMACLQPWGTPTPEPQLTVDAVPLRLLMRGNVESWNLQAVEDLRELSLSQWHEPINLEDDLMIALFGKDPSQVDEAFSSSILQHRSLPSRTRSTAMMMRNLQRPLLDKNLNNFDHKKWMKRIQMALQNTLAV